MKVGKRFLSALLALCMTGSLMLPASLAAGSSADAENTPATLAEGTWEVYVGSEEELAAALEEGADFADSATYEINLTADIRLTAQLTVAPGHANTVINGQGAYSLVNACGDTAITFGGGGLSDRSLTFLGLTLEGNGHALIALSEDENGILTLENVTIRNAAGAGDGILSHASSNKEMAEINLKNVKSESCTGRFLNAAYVRAVNIEDCDLNLDGANSRSGIYLAQPADDGSTLTVQGGTVTYSNGAETYAALEAGWAKWTITAEKASFVGDGTEAALIDNNAGSSISTVILNSCSFEDEDGSQPLLRLSGTGDFITDGKVSGDPVFCFDDVQTALQTTAALSQTVNIRYAQGGLPLSLAGCDVAVLRGVGCTLNETDLSRVNVVDGATEHPLRTLLLDTDENAVVFSRLDLSETDISLDTRSAVDFLSDGTPVFYGSVKSEEIAPSVTLTDAAGNEIGAENYTVSYADNEITASLADGTILKAEATVVPENDLKGDAAVLPFQIEVGETIDLTAENTKTELSYSGGFYGCTVTYTGGSTPVALEEYRSFTVDYEVDVETETVAVTVTGLGYYSGSYTLIFDVPSKSLVTNEEELNRAIASKAPYIEIENDILVDASVVLDYDVVLTSAKDENGNHYTLGAGGLRTNNDTTSFEDNQIAVVIAQGGDVRLTDIRIDGKNVARTLYAINGAKVTVDGDAEIVDAGTWSTSNPVYGEVIRIDSDSEVTLRDCTITGGNAHGYPIDIASGATLNVESGTYITDLIHYASGGCFIGNSGVLNWDGGVFDVNARNLGTYYDTGNAVSNSGRFTFSSGTINGFNENGEPTHTSSGGVRNSGTFIMNGGLITGFQDKETDVAYGTYHSRGVYNSGTFIMTGGEISGNSCIIDPERDNSMSAYGGGVYNTGTFTMEGGRITDNSADQGGGVYNTGTFTMTGGEISGNHLTGTEISGGEEQQEMMDDFTASLSYAGSQLLLYAGGEAEISGGKISGGDTDTITLPAAEGEETGESVEAAIALVSYTIADRDGMSAACSALTVTGEPEIDVNILLIDSHEVLQPVKLSSGDWSTWEIPLDDDGNVAEGYEESEITSYSWLTLDGALSADLNITTLMLDSYTLDSGSMDMFSVRQYTETTYLINESGTPIARYPDRLEPAAADGVWLHNEHNIYEATRELEIAGETENFVGWFLCRDDEIVWLPAQDPTCTEEGNIACWQCSLCGKFFEDHAATKQIPDEEAIIPALGHTAGEALAAISPTCTEDGRRACYACARCGAPVDANGAEYTESELLLDEETGVSYARTGHSYVSVPQTEPTCTEDGHIACRQCENCGNYFSSESDRHELTYEELTTGENGESLRATGHSWITVDGYAATCTEDGLTSGIQCSVCEEWLEEQNTIVRLGGSHELYPITSGDGEILFYICRICGGTYSDASGTQRYTPDVSAGLGGEVEAVCDHVGTAVYVEATPPTCTEDGKSEGVYCSKCGEWLLPQVTLKCAGHTINAVSAVEATCLSDGHTAYYECLECGKIFSDKELTKEIDLADTVVTGSHSLSYVASRAATESEDGCLGHFECAVCGKLFQDASAAVELTQADIRIPATGSSTSSSGSSTNSSSSSGSSSSTKGSSSTGSSSSTKGSSSAGSSSSTKSSSSSSGSSSTSSSSSTGSSGTTKSNVVSASTSGGTVSSGSSSSGSSSSGSSGSSGSTVRINSGSTTGGSNATVVSGDGTSVSTAAGTDTVSAAGDTAQSQNMKISVRDDTGLAPILSYNDPDLMNPTDEAFVAAGRLVQFLFYLRYTDESTLAAEERSAVDAVCSSNGETLSAAYLDISLTKYVDDISEEMEEIPGDVEIELLVPDEMRKTIRENADGTFSVIRVHDGLAEPLEVQYDADLNTVTFRTDRFSTYVLAYQIPSVPVGNADVDVVQVDLSGDEEPVEEESAGNGWLFWVIFIGVLVIVAAAVVVGVVVWRKRNPGNGTPPDDEGPEEIHIS